jgi:hypothetical protein
MIGYNKTVVDMFTWYLNYIVYYTHIVIEGVVFVLVCVAWGLYVANGVFTSVECGIVLLFYTAFAIGIGFAFYEYYKLTILFYDPEVRASWEEEKAKQEAENADFLVGEFSTRGADDALSLTGI